MMSEFNPFLWSLTALTILRILRLLQEDVITEKLRIRLIAWANFDSEVAISDYKIKDYLVYLYGCKWCLGFWLSIIFTIVNYFIQPEVIMWIYLPFALSYLIGRLGK